MARVSNTSQGERRMARRDGISWTGPILGLVVATLLPLAAWKFWPRGQDDALPFQPVTRQVQRLPFRYVVTEDGEIESSENTEVRCEVQARGGGTMILELVPEGTYVHKGDLIARLDSSALRDELTRQQITCNTSRAAVIQAQSTLRAAEIAKQEYLEGTFRQEEQTKLAAVAVAEEELHRAEDYLAYSELLAAKGYVTKLQLEADRFAVEKARMDLAAAKTDLEVLRKYTKAKMLTQLEADIESARANLESQQKSHELDLAQLKLIEDQIAKCEIRAPADGQVVYANKSDRRGNSEVIIEEGAPVRERQVIVRLPDPKRMQVKAEISEARIDRIRPGMPVIIHVDALPDVELAGTVTKVNEYPVPGSWWGNSAKEYATYIQINNPPSTKLRPGMTAEVRILVEEIDEALQVPVQAILEHQGRHFCFVHSAKGLEPRRVQLGSSNEKFVVIREGLNESEQVVMNPRKFLDYVDLPEPTPEELIAANKVPHTSADNASHDASAAKANRSGDSTSPSPSRSASANNTNSNTANTTANNSTTEATPGSRATAPQSANTSGPSAAPTIAASSTESTASANAAVPAGDRPRSTPSSSEGSTAKKRSGQPSAPGNPFQNMSPGQLAGMMVQRMDQNGDGKLSRDELPEQFRSGFDRSDVNKDGFLDTREMTASLARLRAARRNRAGGAAPVSPRGGGAGE